jgi:hypothetical protein
MEIKEYIVHIKNFGINELRPFDLEYDFQFMTVNSKNSILVIDRNNDQIYQVESTPNPILAIRKYIDWMYGVIPLYCYNHEKKDFEETEENEWASKYYEIEETRLCVDLIREG